MTANDEVKKVALFAFNGDFKCFAHVLLNALDMKAKGYDVKVVIEGNDQLVDGQPVQVG